MQFGRQLVVHFYQAGNVFLCSLQLAFQVLDVFLKHARIVLDGLESGGATEPVAGIFDFVRVHGHTLRILFLYAVVEVLRLGERKVTNCWAGISAP
ncbi:hypothetical protein D9M71_771500 [compost metagenome]